MQQRCSFSTQPNKRIVLPRNLIIDPRSSFAPQFTRFAAPAAVAEDDDDETDNNNSSIQTDDASEYDDNDDDVEEYDDDDDEPLFWSKQEGVVFTKPLPERLKVEIHTLFASQKEQSLAGTIHLDASVFGLDPIRVDLLKRAVDYFRARKRGRALATFARAARNSLI